MKTYTFSEVIDKIVAAEITLLDPGTPHQCCYYTIKTTDRGLLLMLRYDDQTAASIYQKDNAGIIETGTHGGFLLKESDADYMAELVPLMKMPL